MPHETSRLERDNRIGPPPVARVVLLGASNVTLGFPTLLPLIRQRFNGPIRILAAHGHGRSYGHWSRALYRDLPGLNHCQLWDDLAQSTQQFPEVPTYAVVTDLGNDLLYGDAPHQIDDWLGDCLHRLSQASARITLGRLPLSALSHLGPRRFTLVKSVFFPGSRLTYEGMQAGSEELDRRVGLRIEQLGLGSFTPRPEWYGIDPIHIRRSFRREAWDQIFSLWPLEDSQHTAKGLRSRSPLESVRTWLLKPVERRIWGRPVTTSQPVRIWPDGSELSLY